MRIILVCAVMATAPLMAGAAWAGEVDVVEAQATRTGGDGDTGYWRFEVALRHADEGWDHYADAWEVLSPDGEALGTRILVHPHVDEQPFTRSLSGVEIPTDLTQVVIRGHDSVHGYGGVELELALPAGE